MFFYRFRRGFQQVFSWCPFVNYDPSDDTLACTTYVMHDTRRGRDTTRFTVQGTTEENDGTRNGGLFNISLTHLV